MLYRCSLNDIWPIVFQFMWRLPGFHTLPKGTMAIMGKAKHRLRHRNRAGRFTTRISEDRYARPIAKLIPAAFGAIWSTFVHEFPQ
jgi:hypothetical protein